MKTVYVHGIGMTSFGKHLTKSLRQLGAEAVNKALGDSAWDSKDIDAVFSGCAVAGMITGQECIRGQVLIQDTGLLGKPIYNIENACATSATAFQLAWLSVASGQYENVLVLGAEKLFSNDKSLPLKAIASAADVEVYSSNETNTSRFMEIYAEITRKKMEKFGYTKEHFAWVSHKNHLHAIHNPHAQYRKEVSVEEILNSRMIADPLTALMCSPIADGACAIVLSSKPELTHGIHIKSSVLRSGNREDTLLSPAFKASTEAYSLAGITPQDVDLAEVHDATASAEVFAYEDLQFVPEGEGWRLVEEKATMLGGRIPVNTSGGLVSKGHPLGATGVSQIYELVLQLRGQAGSRQVENCKIGVAHSAGGWVKDDVAAVAIHVIGR